jgi:hypothetical protein
VADMLGKKHAFRSNKFELKGCHNGLVVGRSSGCRQETGQAALV